MNQKYTGGLRNKTRKKHNTNYCMYVMVMFHLGFTVKPSRASFATEARLADSNTTCAILHG